MWHDLYMKNIKYHSYTSHTIKYGETIGCISETYNNALMPYGHSIQKAVSTMAMEKNVT